MGVLRTILLALAVLAMPATTLAQTSLELSFKGRAEPWQRTEIANQITGTVSEVHFNPGQHVQQGDLLYSMDDAAFRIDVQSARATLAEARAQLALAEDVAGRQARLRERGTGAEAQATRSALEVDIAKAAVARQEADLAAAELALAHTRITAPISGTARSKVAPGAFVEAEGGTILGEIVQTDPILVAYRVSYADRQQALRATGTNSIEELFGQIELSQKLPSGETYKHAGRPEFESAVLDTETRMLTTWGRFPNPQGVLIPGLEVTILARISNEGARGSKE
jgi:RND family efflux transporter MFP subunit